MGLMDILNGMQNGPRGQRQPTGKGGGMSPIVMALLGLLAYKALKGGGLGNIFGGGDETPQRASAPESGGTTQASGDIGDLLKGMFGGNASGQPQGGGGLGGMLGGLLGGTAAGGVLSGGLGNLLKDLQNAGQGHKAQSWIGTGANEEIAPEDLGRALGPDTIDTLVEQTGLDRQELLTGLSDNLPDLVDQLTPNGRLPTEQEAARW